MHVNEAEELGTGCSKECVEHKGVWLVGMENLIAFQEDKESGSL